MKKTIILLFIFIFWNGLPAQSNILRQSEAEMIFFKALKTDIHALAAVENYFYFTAGIIPAETSNRLDEYLAGAEQYHADLEIFNRREQQKDYLKITAYWHYIRHKTVHSYQKNLARKLTEKLENIHQLLTSFRKELQKEYTLQISNNQLTAGKILYYTHWLSTMYIAKQIQRDAYFDFQHNIAMENYQNLLEEVKKYKAGKKKDRKFFTYIYSQMQELKNMLDNEENNPEEIYKQTQLIHQNIYKYLFL